jgi:hypothetical protein
MVYITKFLDSELKAYERDPEKYKKERAEDARRAHRDYERYTDPELMERYQRMKARKGAGGGSGGAASGTREMQLGSELDPKAMMKREGMKKGGKVKKMAAGGMATSKMGAVKTAAPSRDGVATKGKTKGTMVKMAGGGKAKKYC